jgi:hypothetical protein
MKRSWTTADDEVGVDGLGELERLVLSEIDRLTVGDRPRAPSTRRRDDEVQNGGDQRLTPITPLDSDTGVAVMQILGWLSVRGDRDAVVAELVERLTAEGSGLDQGDHASPEPEAAGLSLPSAP